MLQLCTSSPSHEEPLPPSIDFVAEYAALVYAEGVVSEFASEDPIMADVEAHAPSSVVALVVLHGADDSVPDHACDMSTPPGSYKLACRRSDWDKWEAAMCHEWDSLEEKCIFECVSSLPAGRKAIPLMWVYDIKGGLGRETIEKARVVVLGNRQGALDFGETYSAVARATSI